MDDQRSYSEYTLAELEDALRWVDQERYPERHVALRSELSRRLQQSRDKSSNEPNRVNSRTRTTAALIATALISITAVTLISFFWTIDKLRTEEPGVKRHIRSVVEAALRTWDPQPLLDAMPDHLDQALYRTRFEVLFEMQDKLGSLQSLSEPEGNITASASMKEGYSKVAVYSSLATFDRGTARIVVKLSWENERWALTAISITPLSSEAGASNTRMQPTGFAGG